MSFFINEENICRCGCSSQGWTLLKPPGMAAYERIVFYESPFCCNLFVIIGVLIKHASTVGSKRRTQCRAVITFPRPPCEPCNPPQRSLSLGWSSPCTLQKTLAYAPATHCKEPLVNPKPPKRSSGVGSIPCAKRRGLVEPLGRRGTLMTFGKKTDVLRY